MWSPSLRHVGVANYLRGLAECEPLAPGSIHQQPVQAVFDPRCEHHERKFRAILDYVPSRLCEQRLLV